MLDRVLELPREQQPRAVTELGRAHGVERELTCLLAGSRGTSVLDDSLDEVLQQMPETAPARNALKGQVIGHWKLGDEIGRGGMSVVYDAERTGQDFEQHAALKILLVGFLGDDFVASFLRERQILSNLQHPGIARLIDGGITPDGAPFLVMQHVYGERIDRWCEQRGADPRSIAQLVLKLCHAVAYAQRHLVVHQDINPANVLVDEHGQPVLIDFGIAKLLGSTSGNRTLRLFTPQYAAPEQKAGGEITTATDVYTLGALFRHLTDGDRLDADLQLILVTATQADPEKRYANARSLADDLQAWLEQRPVRVRRPTAGYRASRFIARHRWGVAATALAVVALVAGLGVSLWQASIAANERDLARVESARAMQVTGFLKDLFRASDPDRARGRAVSASELLNQGAYQARNAKNLAPELKAGMVVLVGDLYREMGDLEAAAPLLREGLDLADTAGDVRLRVDARRALAVQEMESGNHEHALALAEEGEQLLRQAGRIPGRQHASLMQPILFSLTEMGRVTEAVERSREVLALMRGQAKLPAMARYQYLYSVANVMLIAEHADEAESLLLEAAGLEFEGAGDPSTQMDLHTNLAGVYKRKGDMLAALKHDRKALALAEEIYPPEHPRRARKLSNLGSTLVGLGRYREAERVLHEALSIYEHIYKDDAHPRVAAAHNNLGRALEAAGRFSAAEPHLTRAWELAAQLFGKNDPRYLIATGNLGNLQRKLGNLDRADELLQESLSLRRSILGPKHRAVGNGLALLAALRLDQGRPAEALKLSDEALALFQRIGYKDPRAIVATRTRRARALAALGRVEEAKDGFAKALSISEEEAIDAGRAWPELLAAHADFLVGRGDPGARAAVEKALKVYRQMLGADHPATRRIEAQLRTLAATGPGARADASAHK